MPDGGASEADLGHLLGGRAGFKVRAVLVVAGNSSPDIVGKLQHKCVVLLQRVVVALIRAAQRRKFNLVEGNVSTPSQSEVTPQRIMQFAWGYAPPLILEAAIRHRVFDVLDGGRKPPMKLRTRRAPQRAD